MRYRVAVFTNDRKHAHVTSLLPTDGIKSLEVANGLVMDLNVLLSILRVNVYAELAEVSE